MKKHKADLKILGTNLRYWRERTGLTPEQAAERLTQYGHSITAKKIVGIEHGDTSVSISVIFDLQEIYGTSVEAFLLGYHF